MAKNKKIIAVIVAGGLGIRYRQTKKNAPPKQYRLLGGKTVLHHAIEKFLSVKAIENLVVVIHPKHKKLYNEVLTQIKKNKGADKILPAVYGGQDRQTSVFMGLQAIQKHSPNLVLIHDSARPHLSQKLIEKIIGGLEKNSAIIPAIPLTSALKKKSGNGGIITADRNQYLLAQTPQGFDYQKLLLAHRAEKNHSWEDDASLWQEHYDEPIATIMGDGDNIKITTTDDMKILTGMMVGQKKTISCLGVDCHRFGDAKKSAKIMLAGVALPSAKPLLAHSDGDVILHALCDAILGAVGHDMKKNIGKNFQGGDIGVLFSPNDKKWKGASSQIFLDQTLKFLTEKNGRLTHVDITLLLSEPKISPYRLRIVKNLAKLLNLSPQNIGLKATTTENMGVMGRGEGIMAFCQISVDFLDE